MSARALPLALLAAVLCACAVAAQDAKKQPPAEPKKEKEKEAPDGPAMQKLKQAEEAYRAAREEAYKEIVEAEKKARAALEQAQKDLGKAGADRDARTKAREAFSKAQAELARLTQTRFRVMTPSFGPVIASLPPVKEETRFGAQFSRPSELLVAHLNLGKDRGLVIDRVDRGRTADLAGLKAHDILVEVNGKPVPSSIEQFRALLADIKPNAAVPMVVLRKGKSETIKDVKLPAAAQPGRR